MTDETDKRHGVASRMPLWALAILAAVTFGAYAYFILDARFTAGRFSFRMARMTYKSKFPLPVQGKRSFAPTFNARS